MFKLPNYIFYRTYDETTILYNTYTQTVYHFNDTIGIVLDYIRQGLNEKQIVIELHNQYGNDIEEAQNIFDEVVSILIKENILPDNQSISASLEERCILDITDNNHLFSVLFEITYKCNEKCRHCYVCNQNEPELTFEEIKNILIDLKKLNVLNIVFTGGDVFCRKDFLDILVVAHELGFVVDIYTNGLLCDDTKVIEIARRHPRSIHFSIYSTNPQKHDEFTQIPNSFSKTIDVATKFRDLGVAVNFKTTLLDMNYAEMSDIIDFSRNFGASLQIGTVLRLKQDGSDTPLSLKVQKDIYLKTIPLISKKLNRKKEDVIKCRNANSRICGAGFTSISINPYGKVFACSSLPLVMGDIRQSSIIDIWQNSPQLKKWKESTWDMIHQCNKCEKSSICSFCPGIAMQYNDTPFNSYEDGCIVTEATLAYINQ